MIPEPIAFGNNELTILKHEFFKERIDHDCYTPARVDLAIRNISNSTIATAILEAKFFDAEGKIVDIIRHRESELRGDTSRSISIYCKNELSRIVKSYNITVIKVITADQEKVQFCSHEVTADDAGDENFSIVVKNISDEKTDTAVVASFFNSYKDNIGTKIFILKDIEPNRTKKFCFSFKPQEGDQIRTYTFDIGDVVET